jgi:plastocyanin
VKIEPLDRSIALRRRSTALVLALAVIASVWTLNSERASAASFTVNAKDFAFSPAALTVRVGDTVKWVNGDAESHAAQGGSLASPEIIAGSSWSTTFTAPEEISYTCRFHTYMTGTISVLAASAAPAAPVTTKPAATAGGAATTVPAAPITTAATVAPTTTVPKATFQDVPDDPSGRIPPSGDGRSQGTPNAPSAGNPPTTRAGSTTPTTLRGSQFQDVPPDATANHSPGGEVVTAQSASQEAVIHEDDPAPPAGDKPAGDGTVLADFIEVEGVKVFHLTLDELPDLEVEPGVKKSAYAINGSVPAPTIKVDEGDRVRIVVKNDLPFPTSTHWHGMILPNDQDGVGGITQPHIEPGTEYTYEWTAVATGTHWYHAHSSGRHIGKGLYGALIVVPKKDDLKSDEDYTLMLGDTDLGFTINGRSFPSTPILDTKVGDTVRLRVVNTGDQVHAFHLHGVPFRVMAQDGMPKPQVEQMDTLTISPGQTFDLLFEQRYPGDWVIHCHMFIHSHMNADVHPPGESGMNGMTAIVRAAAGTPKDDAEAAAGSDVVTTPVSSSGGESNTALSVVAALLVVLAFGLLYRRTREQIAPTP